MFCAFGFVCIRTVSEQVIEPRHVHQRDVAGIKARLEVRAVEDAAICPQTGERARRLAVRIEVIAKSRERARNE